MDIKQQKIKIGGGNDGICTWIIQKGVKVVKQNPIIGWEMKFLLDPNGIVSGGNKNDNEVHAQKKQYTGTFKNGIIDCIATFEDGSQIKYDGKVEGKQVKIKCTVLKGGQLFQKGDISENMGTIKYE